MSKKKRNRNASTASAEAGRRNLPAVAQTLIADARNDITIPFFTDVLQPTDDTLIARGGGKGLKIYDEVERDPYIWAVLQKRKKTLLAREWEVRAGGEQPIDQEAADFLKDVFTELSFDRICEDLLDATLKGFAVSEVVWRRDGRHIKPVHIMSHDQRRLSFDHDWRPRLLTMRNMLKGEELPERKFIVHRHGVKGNNPFGLGLGTRLFWCAMFKREGVAFWLHFLDKFAAPTVIGKSPYGTLESQQRDLLDTLSSIVTRSAITVPIGTDVEFLEAARSGSVSYLEWCTYWDKQASICVTGETLTSDIGNSGSRAAAETHQEILEMLVDADADLLSATLRDQLIAWLIEYNYPGAAVPEIWRVRPENEKLTAETRQATAEAASAENTAILGVVVSAAHFDDDEAARDFIVSFGITSRLSDATIARLVEARFAFMEGGRRGRDIRQLGLDRLSDPLKKKALNPIQALFAEPADWRVNNHIETADALIAQIMAAASPLVGERLDEIRSALLAGDGYKDASSRLASLEDNWAYDRLAPLISAGMELAILAGREAALRELHGDDDADSFAEADVFNQPFREQIEFLRQKEPLETEYWNDLLGGAHDQRFVIAGATDLAMLADFQKAIADALEGGTPFAEFQKEFDAIVEKYGWEFRGDRAWRARVIFETNMRTAYMAGRLKQMSSPAMTRMRPFWQYRHGETRTPLHPRPDHLSWDGLVLAWDDEWWKTHFPPNGFFCSCGVRSLSRRDLARMGKEGPDKAPEPLMEAVIDPDTGKLVEREQGLGHGWDYMPGQRWIAAAA